MFSGYMLLRPGRACGCGPVRQLFRASNFTSKPTQISQPRLFAALSRSRPLPQLRTSLLSAGLRPYGGRLLLRAVPRRATSTAPKTKLLPEKLLVYHAGTPRTTFLACLKVTTVFGLAFFTFLICPSYLASGKPWYEALGVAVCGIVPFAIVAYTTSPFVAFVHLRLPPFARHPDRTILGRFVHTMPPQTTLVDITTMNLVGRPRVSTVAVGDLEPAQEKMRIVNLKLGAIGGARGKLERVAPGRKKRATSTSPSSSSSPGTILGLQRSAKFPWVSLPPTTRFGAPVGNNSRGMRHAWAWAEVVAGIEKRAAEKGQ